MVIVPSTWPLLYRIGSHDSFALHTIACFCFRSGAGFVEWEVPKIAVWAGEGRITCAGMCARRKLACVDLERARWYELARVIKIRK